MFEFLIALVNTLAFLIDEVRYQRQIHVHKPGMVGSIYHEAASCSVYIDCIDQRRESFIWIGNSNNILNHVLTSLHHWFTVNKKHFLARIIVLGETFSEYFESCGTESDTI